MIIKGKIRVIYICDKVGSKAKRVVFLIYLFGLFYRFRVVVRMWLVFNLVVRIVKLDFLGG